MKPAPIGQAGTPGTWHPGTRTIAPHYTCKDCPRRFVAATSMPSDRGRARVALVRHWHAAHSTHPTAGWRWDDRIDAALGGFLARVGHRAGERLDIPAYVFTTADERTACLRAARRRRVHAVRDRTGRWWQTSYHRGVWKCLPACDSAGTLLGGP